MLLTCPAAAVQEREATHRREPCADRGHRSSSWSFETGSARWARTSPVHPSSSIRCQPSPSRWRHRPSTGRDNTSSLHSTCSTASPIRPWRLHSAAAAAAAAPTLSTLSPPRLPWALRLSPSPISLPRTVFFPRHTQALLSAISSRPFIRRVSSSSVPSSCSVASRGRLTPRQLFPPSAS